MTKRSLTKMMAVLLFMAISFSSCQAIESIFKAGVWVGVIAVVVVIAVIFWLINKAGKK
jgi:hypothetical protein